MNFMIQRFTSETDVKVMEWPWKQEAEQTQESSASRQRGGEEWGGLQS